MGKTEGLKKRPDILNALSKSILRGLLSLKLKRNR